MNTARKEIRSLKAQSWRRRRSRALDDNDIESSLLNAIDEEGSEEFRSEGPRSDGTRSDGFRSGGSSMRDRLDIARMAAEAVAEVDGGDFGTGSTPPRCPQPSPAGSRRVSIDVNNAAAEPTSAPRNGKQLWGVARGSLVARGQLPAAMAPGSSPYQQNGNGTAEAYHTLPHHESNLPPFNRANTAKRDRYITVRSQSTKNIVESFLASVTGSLALEGAILVEEEMEQPGMFSPKTDFAVIKRMIFTNYLSILLLCVPLGIFAGLKGWSPTIIFTANFVALIPLALLLGEVTEDLAVRFGDVVGGLLNATFGNVVEMILSLAALQKGLYTVVAASLIGSILSNLLLVLGMCFLFGGMKFKEQHFSSLANKVSCSLLFLACAAIITPTTAEMFYGKEVITDATLIELSHAIAGLLIAVYGGYLFFQLKTHADAFAGEENTDVCALSLSGAIAMLSTITVIVAICSEFLTGAIEEVSERFKINQAFLGLIVLPIAGNAAEHITAVFVAVKNKMDLALGVALGSSIQIAIFVIPFTVIAGWLMGRPFTLNFDPFAVLMLTVSVILAYFVSSDGHSNWLLGLQLISTYILIGFVFYLEREPGSGKAPSPPGAGLDMIGNAARRLMAS